MTVEIREVPIERLAEQGDIPISFVVDSVLEPTIVDGGLGGIVLREAVVEPAWTKEYDVDGHRPADWPRTFDVTRWGLLWAMDGDERVGGAVVAHDTPGVDLLRGRRDLAVVWDLRVRPDRRAAGIGSALWRACESWARDRDCVDIEVETQNVNVAACRFYERMGCVLSSIDRFAYAPELPDEIELRWRKTISVRPT